MHGDKYFKIIPPVSLRPFDRPFALFLSWRDRREEDDSLPQDSHNNNAGLVTEKTTEAGKEREKEIDRARTCWADKA